MKKTSEQKVADILALLQQGVSIREVAPRVPVSKSLVSKIRQKHSITTKTSKGGRPPKLSVQTKRLIVRKITSGECDTATEAQKNIKKRARHQFSCKYSAKRTQECWNERGNQAKITITFSTTHSVTSRVCTKAQRLEFR